MKVRTDDPGIYGVHSHTFWGKLQRGASGKLIDSRFADTICENIWKRADASHTRHDNDIAFAFDNRRKRELTELKDRSYVDIHHDVIIGQACIFDCAVRNNTGRIDQDIDAT